MAEALAQAVQGRDLGEICSVVCRCRGAGLWRLGAAAPTTATMPLLSGRLKLRVPEGVACDVPPPSLPHQPEVLEGRALESHQVDRARLGFVGSNVGIEGVVAIDAAHVGADEQHVGCDLEVREALLGRARGFFEGHI